MNRQRTALRYMNAHRARATGLLAFIACLGALAAPAPARADVVTDWNLNTLQVTAGQDGRLVAVLHLAMMHGAVYDAVNAIDGGHEGYLISSRLATPSDSKEAAAATAAYRVLLWIVPAQQPVLDAQYAASLAGITNGPSKTRGIAVGEAAAAAMIAARTNDGRFGLFRFLVGTAPGAWRPVLPAFVNDPNAWLKDLKPFLIRSSSQFRSDGPYRLTSRKYAKEFAEVKSLGSLTSTRRTPDQTHAARYWAENPTATWARTFRTLAAQEGLSVVDSARMFAMAYLSTADVFISVWDDKAHWSFWRPITAIRLAGTDGNPRTEPDDEWLPLLATPPYPDHSSGLSGVGGASVKTLQQFFGTDKVAWTDTTVAGLTRSFTRFSQAIDEIVDARVWSGIHFRKADVDGARIGRQVAKWGDNHYFRPVRDHDDDDDKDDD
jgi:hypothetical protein